ncbi:MAG: Hsp70 family protein [Desulfobacter sp.]|nr:MAG: Hsp70 family protein [Desulfobacter sp.]
MADIFISYASQDRKIANALADILSQQGWSVWWDRKIPAGKRFAQTIEKAIADARCLIVLWSLSSVGSDWVGDEADEGRSRGILIPVLIEDIRPPMGFRRIHTADLSGWKGGAHDHELKKLLADIAAMTGSPGDGNKTPGTKPVTPPALQGILGLVKPLPSPGQTTATLRPAVPATLQPTGEYVALCIRAYLIGEFRKEEGIDLNNDSFALYRLNEAADKAQKELSRLKQTRLYRPFITAETSGPKHLDMVLTRSKLWPLVIVSLHLTEEFRKDSGIDLQKDAMAVMRLVEAAGKALDALSASKTTTVVLPFVTADASGPLHLKVELTRSQIRQLTSRINWPKD